MRFFRETSGDFARTTSMENTATVTQAKLPEDVGVLHGMVRELLALHADSQKTIARLEHRLDALLKRLYGPKADRLNPDQPSLFGAPAEPLPPVEPQPEPAAASAPANRSPKRPGAHGRQAIPDHLRRERIEIDIPEAEKLAFGGTWLKIGEEVSERLDYTPASLFVRQIVRPKYVVRRGNAPDELKVAELPAEALPKSKAAPGLVADVIVAKLVDHLPLYRQEQRYARQGVEIARSTLCGWLAEAADVVTPLYALLRSELLAADIVWTDDSPVRVQDHQDYQGTCRTARIWTYLNERGIVYDATPDRTRAGPEKFLANFAGFLQCDAYTGYDGIFASGKVTEVACWAHARRKFTDAQSYAPALAAEAVARIRQLYDVEDEAKAQHRDAPARAKLRQEKSKPMLDALGAWLEETKRDVLPKNPLAEALGYALNQWKALNVYVTDGRLSIDNNAAERAIKPFAIGRRNWLFFGSDDGGQTLAVLARFTATCLQRKIDPWKYLKDVLTRLPNTPTDQRATLLPHAWAVQNAMR